MQAIPAGVIVGLMLTNERSWPRYLLALSFCLGCVIDDGTPGKTGEFIDLSQRCPAAIVNDHPSEDRPCAEDDAILEPDGQPTGYGCCTDGTINRLEAVPAPLRDGCLTDDDCLAYEICFPGLFQGADAPNSCIRAGCTNGESCTGRIGSNQCTLRLEGDGCGDEAQLRCRSVVDDCRVDDHCPGQESVCSPEPWTDERPNVFGEWTCHSPPNCE